MNLLYIVLLVFGAQATLAAAAMFAWLVRIGVTAAPPARVIVDTTATQLPGVDPRVTIPALRVLDRSALSVPSPGDDGHGLAA